MQLMVLNDELKFFPLRIKSARVACGMTQSELAQRIDKTKGVISQYESGLTRPPVSIMVQIADILDRPLSFFARRPIAEEAVPSATFHRALKTTPAKVREASREEAAIFAEFVTGAILQYVDLPEPNLPQFNECPKEYTIDDCEQIAAEARAYWRLGDGPIKHMVDILQENGIIIAWLNEAHKKVDAFSVIRNGIPYIFASKGKDSSVRFRFSLAHELGHLLLHSHLSEVTPAMHDQLEWEANHFASAFLLPQNTFFCDVAVPSLDHLLYLKNKWLVSVQSMIMRCKAHHIFADEQCTNLYKQLSYRGWRTKEPNDDICSYESPYLLSQAIRLIVDNGIVSREDIDEYFGTCRETLAHMCAIPFDYLEPKATKTAPKLRIVN